MWKKGHFSGASICKSTKKKEKTRNVAEDSSTESDVSVGRVEEKSAEKVNAVKDDLAKVAKLSMKAFDHGVESDETEVELLIDSGVNKTLLSEKDWNRGCQRCKSENYSICGCWSEAVVDRSEGW